MCRACNHPATPPIAIPPRGAMGSFVVGIQLALPLWGDEVGYPLPKIDKRNWDGIPIPPVMVACSACDAEFAEDDEDNIPVPHSQDSSRLLCSNCRSECEECNEAYDSDDSDLHSAHDNDRGGRRGESSRCESCSWRCADCRDWFYGDANKNSADEDICQSCSESYSSCEDCSDIVSNDDIYHDDMNESYICRSCYNNRGQDEDGDSGDNDEDETPPRRQSRRSLLVNPYTYKPPCRFYFAAGEKSSSPAIATTFYGLEIETETEVEGDERNHDKAIRESGLNDDAAFYCKRDGSLADDGKAGFEIVSHPGTYRYWIERDWTFASKLVGLDYASETENCGLHIHVSRTCLSPAQIAKLLLFTKRNAKLFAYLSGRINSEQMEHYAPIETAGTRGILNKVNGVLSREDIERYAAINLKNEHTIEFRLFQGSLDPSIIKRNIALVAALIDFTKRTTLGRLECQDFRSYLARYGVSVLGRESATALLAWIDCWHNTSGFSAA